MAGYNELRGLRVKYLSADPANPEDGQVWYNSTTGNLRVQGIGSYTWSSGASSNEVFNYSSGSLQGTQTAAIVGAMGADPRSKSESYNGTGFSTEADLTNGRGNGEVGGGAGTATAALCYNGTPGGGPILNFIEEYNGTSWSEVNDLNTGRVQVCGAGIETAALCYSGTTAGGATLHNETEEYNGTSWSEQNNLATARRNGGGNGIQTSAIMVGGFASGTVYNNTEEYDGTSWTAGTNYPTNVRGISLIATSSSNAVAFGGSNPPSAIPGVGTRTYDGTAWTSVSDLGSVKQNANGIGTTSTGLAIGTTGPATQASSEELNFGSTTITPAAWSSGGALPKEQGQGGGCGTQNAGLTCGGLTPASPPLSELTDTFEYDGSAWSSGGSLPFARRNNSNFGIQTSALTLGDLNPASNSTDIYNGSTWTSGTNYPAPVSNTGTAGTTTAGLVWGADQDPGFLSTTNEYDGSWTAGGALPAGKSNVACAGTQTAALSVGGYEGPAAPAATVVNTSIEYDGSTWTSGGTDLIARYNAGGAGIQTSALIFGGATPSSTAQATLYDGTSFATQPSLGTARFFQTQGLGATSSAALGAGGQSTVRVSITEEFNPETITTNPASNLSVS